MKPDERFYKGYRQVSSDLNLERTVVLVDSTDFKKPSTISLEMIGDALQLKLDEDITSKNISAVEYLELDSKPTSNPGTLPISPKTHISVDENYLYVWIPKLGKWKRIPLSDWPQES